MSLVIKLRDRRVQAYLKPANFATFNRVVQVEGMSESKCLNLIIKEWFNNLSDSRKEEYFSTHPEEEETTQRA
jgi:hypothetical protein